MRFQINDHKLPCLCALIRQVNRKTSNLTPHYTKTITCSLPKFIIADQVVSMCCYIQNFITIPPGVLFSHTYAFVHQQCLPIRTHDFPQLSGIPCHAAEFTKMFKRLLHLKDHFRFSMLDAYQYPAIQTGQQIQNSLV